MNKFHILSLICFILGIAFFLIGFLTGEAEGGLFIVFPFIVGSGFFPLLGFIFILIAIFSFIFGLSTYKTPDENQIFNDELQSKKKTSVKGGGVVLIGPIPIVFGSSWKIAIVLMIIALILIITFFTLNNL
jgi:uncharacterized protein (TIGR00304 family)